MTKKFFEGVKFGDKEKALILKNAKDFNVGIEYEMHFKPPIDFHELTSDGYEFLISKIEGSDLREEMEDIYNAALDNDSYLEDITKDFPSILKMMYALYDYEQFVKKNVRPDIDVDAAFGGEQDELFDDEKTPELFLRALKKTFEDNEIKWEDAKQVLSDLKSHSPQYEDIILLMDAYYDGELFDDDGSMGKYSDYLKILTVIATSEEEKGITGMVDSMANTEIGPPTPEEELTYTMGKVNSDTIKYEDYNSYRLSNEPIEVIEDIVLDYFREHGHDYIHEMSGDEEGIPTEGNLADNGVDTTVINAISTDHGDQAEVITEQMDVIQAFENISQMFNFIDDHAETSNISGMHVSISTNKYDLDDFNMMKFVALLDMDHVLELFPERQYVYDLSGIINGAIKDEIAGTIEEEYISNNGKLSATSLVKSLARAAKYMIDTEKYQSIKFGDYKIMDGRIELRFFGGEYYESMENEIKHHILRALYLLNFAYTDEYNNVFYKKIAKMVNGNVKDKYGVTISTLVSAIDKVNKMFPEKITGMYERYVDSLGSYQSDDLKMFDRFMKKTFGNEWYRRLDFLRGLYE